MIGVGGVDMYRWWSGCVDELVVGCLSQFDGYHDGRSVVEMKCGMKCEQADD